MIPTTNSISYLFTPSDIIDLSVSPSGTFLNENEISWASDRSTKFVQTQGFVSKGNIKR